MGVALSGSATAAADHRGTSNLEAYEQFLRGNEYLQQVAQLWSANELAIAADFFEQAVALDPEYALAHAQLARVQALGYELYFDRSQSRLDGARESAERALELAPNLPEGRLAMGEYFRNATEFDQALREYELARQSRPADATIVQKIGELRRAAGDLGASFADFDRALELDPTNAALHCRYGASHMMASEYAPALERHARVIETRPERPCAYWCSALILLNSEGPEATHRWLAAIPDDFGLYEDPQIAHAFFVVDLALGHFDEALARLESSGYRTAESLNFYYPIDLLAGDVYRLLADEDRAAESYRDALGHLEEKLAARPEDTRLLSSLGLALAGLGRPSAAIAAGRRALELEPLEQHHFNGPFRLRDLAQIYVMVGELDAALETLEDLFSAMSMLDVPEIRVDPRFAALRGDPRFECLKKAAWTGAG